ncbi:MAG: AAA family ATPase, partial [Saprospiraceae bacterium]|nr:AAA family ATPase [Saprospiraceae bacterium]
MLHRLFIQNYAIIEQQEIAFEAGLSIITGETGAGKSILLGALSLVMGQRADSKVLYHKEQKAVVEATFVDYPPALHSVLEAHDLDILDSMILRREILPSGKSRAFVNDTPVRLDLMQIVSGSLVDLHQQFESLEIQESSMQYEILDAFAGISDNVLAYRKTYRAYLDLNQRISQLEEQRRQAMQQRDYLEFQFEELQSANLEAGQLEEWESEYHLLSNATEIKRILSEGAEVLNGAESSVVDQLRLLVNALEPHLHEDSLRDIAGRMRSLSIEAEDLSQEMHRGLQAIDPDPAQQHALETRIDTVRRLMMKHGVTTDAELVDLQTSLAGQLEESDALDQDLEHAVKERDETLSALSVMAHEISQQRTTHAGELGQVVMDLLHDLEMKHAVLRVEVTPLDAPAMLGMDQVEFLFSANLGAEQMPIKKVASGGELSRLSLCIKSVVSQKMQLPTLIFDEIDTGVSGQVALKMGQLLHALAANHQVIM